MSSCCVTGGTGACACAAEGAFAAFAAFAAGAAGAAVPRATPNMVLPAVVFLGTFAFTGTTAAFAARAAAGGGETSVAYIAISSSVASSMPSKISPFASAILMMV